MTSSRGRDESGGVRWMLVVWFLVFLAAYGVVVGVVMTMMEPGPDQGAEIMRVAGLPGVIIAFVGAKFMTRKRHYK